MSGWGVCGGDDAWGDGGDSNGFGDDGGNSKPKNDGCFNCGGDHRRKDCDKPDLCRNCKKEGHLSKECPEKKLGGGDDNCRKCGKSGHFARDCELPDVCRNCGEEGHMSKECTEEPKTRVIEKDGVKTEIYVPKECTTDELFEQGISSGVNFDNFDKMEIQCDGINIPPAVQEFKSAGLRDLLLQNVEKSGYIRPTPIQKQAIPIALAKRDLVGCAQTGSGKTAAFLLPILHNILASDDNGCNPLERPQKPQAVIVAPTRELAIQIKDEARKFSQNSILKCCVAYGGTSTQFQTNTLLRGCNVLIATVGRLLDFVDRGLVSFEKVQHVVLDEADRMLDMGFLPSVEKIMTTADMPPKGSRQTMMFSATFPEEVKNLAKDFLENYLFLRIGLVGVPSSDVKQSFFEVEKYGKRDKLKEILADVGTQRTMVFVETKRNADFIAGVLSQEGIPTTSIHGDRLQREREEALRDFKKGTMPVLVATAVAARGLDIKGVQHVINYDLPKTVDEYVHRIGRTGRVGNVGRATSFFESNQDSELAPALCKVLADAGEEVPDFLQGGNSGGGGYASEAGDAAADDGW